MPIASHPELSTARRVCLVPLTIAESGTETIVEQIARRLHREGREVFLLIPSVPELDAYAERLTPIATEIARLRPVHGSRAVGHNFLAALRAIRRWRPDVVHFHCASYRWGTDVVLAARAARVRTVRTEHNPIMRPAGPVERAAMAFVDSGVASFTYVSEGNRRRYEAYFKSRRGRGVVVANGIDPMRFQPSSSGRDALRDELGLPREAKIAVAFGSLSPSRRPLAPVMQALAELLSEEATAGVAGAWRLAVLGVSDLDREASPWARTLGDRLLCLGHRTDVQRVLASADLYMSASHFEGLSLTMLEAWACGLPVLTTPVDGVEDVAGEHLPMLTFPHGDISALREKWYALMRAPDRHARVASQLSTKVRTNFNSEVMLDSYLRLYDAPHKRRVHAYPNDSLLAGRRHVHGR